MKTKLDDDFEDDLDVIKMFNKTSKVITRQSQQHEHFYKIDYTLTSFEQSDELIKLLLTANSGDLIRLYISSAGGRLDVSELIVSRIQEAIFRGITVIAELGFQVCSAATQIALSCSDMIPSPNTQWMIHAWSGWGGYGAATDIFNDAVFSKKQSDAFLQNTYAGFLTDDEIKEIQVNPKSLWFNADEVEERWEKYLAYHNENDDPAVQSINLKDLVKETLLEIEADKLKDLEIPTIPKRGRKKKIISDE